MMTDIVIPRRLVLCLILFLSIVTYGQEDSLSAPTDSLLPAVPWPVCVQQRLDGLMESGMFERSQLGLMVYDLTADSVIFRRGERQLMRPASTMKLFTAVAAIERLGGSYRFSTDLRYDGEVTDATLTGHLYCIGGFDPLFNIDDMRAFVESVKNMGIDTIRGAIVADKSMKDTLRLGEGWCWDDDNPILSPLLISRRDVFVKRFIDELQQAGITVEATVEEGVTPCETFPLCTRFHSIDQVLMRKMKQSDNLFAESMFYHLALSNGHRPATAEMARRAIRQLIKRCGGTSSYCRVADGSGLSLYNYVTAEQEVMLLRYAYKQSNIFLHLQPSLPVAGEDGTLRSRMKGGFANGNVRAKTGTLTAISSLAGYLTAPNGHVLCFSIINQGLSSEREGRLFQDQLCDALCQP